MTVVYLDSVFVLNGLMDYLLVLATARLAGLTLRRGRYALAGLAGGLYAAAAFLPGLGFLTEAPVKAAVGVLLAVIAYGGEAQLLRMTLLLFAVACGMAGCVLALGLLAGHSIPMAGGIFYTDVDATVLLIAAAAAYLVLTVVFRAAARHAVRGELVPVRIALEGRTVELTALCDTGNTLRDPATGRQVLVAEGTALAGLWPGELRELFTPELLRFPADLLGMLYSRGRAERFRLVPYHTVGVPGGLLLAVRSDWTEAAGQRYEHLLVALSPTELGGGYGALWGGRERTEKHERLERTAAGAADTAGTAAAGHRPLHRRQRHPAPASEPGAGGGAAGAAGGGGRPPGADRA